MKTTKLQQEMLDSIGLGGETTADPPKFKELKNGAPAISLLAPGSEHHEFVLSYLLERIKMAEDAMSKFYPRWQIAERKMQAYLNLPNYEQMLKDMNDSSKPPAPAIIMFPYKYAVVSTIVTYGMNVFCSKDPMFNLGADSKEAADVVRYMETMLQRHAEKSKMIARIWQLLLDGQVYGMGVVRCMWDIKQGKRTVVRPPTESERMMYASNPDALPSQLRTSEERVVWAGNDVCNIDPFMFFPDPNVPMTEVSDRGEFVFWREFVGKHILLSQQNQGNLAYVDKVEPSQGDNHDSKWWNLSHRSVLAGGDAHAGDNLRKNHVGQNNTYMFDQGTVEIIPAELGLGPETKPVKWLFGILNKTQIVQAQEVNLNHGRHPIEVSEPYTLGYSFGSPALGDYIGPVQDILSWFVDSHIYNVRAALNNQWVFDPSKVDEKSLKYPQPGKHIRLKPLAYGTDVRTAIQQLPVQDVTRNHMSDLQVFTRIGDMVSAVNDTARGVQPTGGRRTATENRMTGEAGASRLAGMMKLISQQAIVRIVEQMTLNIQQLQDMDMWTKVIGQEAMAKAGQQLLSMDFTFPAHDGTLPLDRIANFEHWKEILFGMAQSQVLQTTHSFPKIFEYVAQLGGATNISSFRLVSEPEMDKLAQMGAAIPLPGANGQIPVPQ